MCGIVGVISEYPVNPKDVLSMRRELVHRGPDDSGLAVTVCGTLGHQRLSIIDPTSNGHQPMSTSDGRFTLVYNGELYNDEEIRGELASLGVTFETRCDTETVLQALATWGMEARHKLRGMYAFGLIDTRDRVCLLARDPLGIKPLYTARVGSGGGALVFGSEIRSVLAHPRVDVQPDRIAMSAYLTTIRPEFGSRTMFAGVESVTPGEWALYSTGSFERLDVRSCWEGPVYAEGAVADTRGVIEDSIVRHLRTDVPMCSLLSGGLDSSIIARVAMDRLGGLRTFCAGARGAGFDDDFAMARVVAERLGTEHTEVEISPDGFVARWRSMVWTGGVPLSTPNEVAIYEVCARMRGEGYPVTLSGEGADELFGGYETPMMQAQAFVDGVDDSDSIAGAFHLHTNGWIGNGQKSRLLKSDWLDEVDGDAELRGWYQSSFDALRSRTTDSMQAHLGFHRRMNLSNLLRRLDTASMLSSVEGRTPFADFEVARFAESLPMDRKFVLGEPSRTKIALREAFAGDLPREVIERPKASFPLPFQEWMRDSADLLLGSDFLGGLMNRDAVVEVAGDVSAHWNFAWPMLNLAIWGERWWGDGGSVDAALSSGSGTIARL